MPTPTIKVVALVCNSCTSRLSGDWNDRVFFCTGCAAAYEISGSSLERLALMEAVMPPMQSENIRLVNLPVWVFDVETEFVEFSDKQMKHASGFLGPGKVFVPAFRVTARGFYGDAGVSLTRGWYFGRIKGEEIPIRMQQSELRSLDGCEIGSATAAVFVEHTLLSVIDPVVDVTGLKVSTTIRKKALVSVPFRISSEKRVGCMNLRDEFPLHSILCLRAKKNPDISGGEPIPGS